MYDGPRDRGCYSLDIGKKMVDDAEEALRVLRQKLVDGEC